MNAKKIASAAMLTLGLMVAPVANAQLIGSTVGITAGNGFTGGGFICKNAAVSRTVLGGGELLGSDWNSTGCVGSYSADITNSGFTLTVQEGGNYSWAQLVLNFTGASAITGASFIGYSNFFEPNHPHNDANFAPVVSYTSSSVTLLWDTGNDNSQFRFDDNQVGTGTASFSITTARTTVPEPATFVLLSAGLGIVGLLRRRRA